VDESIMPRLYREAPLNSIWEGSGNVNALDVLRAIEREPRALEAYFAELDEVRGADRRLDGARALLDVELSQRSETTARRVVELLATVLQASLLVRHGDPAVADVFCDSRLAGGHHHYGTLRPSEKLKTIVERAGVRSAN
jgi:putative acyl-CoA dehydrogenase